MTATENPIDNDGRLKNLLSGIKDIKTKKAYNTWRKQFLKIYTKYLDSNGILNGKDANYRLLKQLEKLENRMELIRPVLEQETVDTTNGRRLLTNLTNEVVATERKVQELMPKTNADEERFGFDKFELAAVLLEDGFHGYDAMIKMRQDLESVIGHLVHENTNEIAIIHQYSDSVESFIKVMEDLKLVRIMNHCVDVVYKGTKRPKAKPPPPPPDEDEDQAQELPEDSSICSDPDADNLEVAAAPAKSGRRTKSSPGNSNTNTNTNTPEDIASTKNKKKKPNPTGKSSKAPVSTKKKNGSKKKGDPNYATEEAFEEDNVGSSKPSKQSRKSKMSQAPPPRKPNNDDHNDDSDSDSDDSEDSEKEDEDEDDDEKGVAEFLIYFDPKTNSIGRIPRQVAATKSTLVVDKSSGEEQYKNLVESQDEKQELIFKLKKLERQKPREESWLEAIKREKAAAKAKNAPQKKFNKSTARISRRNSNQGGKKIGVGTSTFGSGGNYKSPLGVDKKKAEAPLFLQNNPNPNSNSNPLEDGASSSKKGGSKGKPKKYKYVAEKPDSSGWSKPAQ